MVSNIIPGRRQHILVNLVKILVYKFFDFYVQKDDFEKQNFDGSISNNDVTQSLVVIKGRQHTEIDRR